METLIMYVTLICAYLVVFLIAINAWLDKQTLKRERVMSKAKERAFEAYPYIEGYDVELPYPSTYDVNEGQRRAYMAGYRQAMNDIIEKAMDFLWEQNYPVSIIEKCKIYLQE